jgi:fructose-bisphosphate aldolase class I
MSTVKELQTARIVEDKGVFVAFDESGGTTRKTLQDYGVPPSAYKNDEEMFVLAHDYRTRMMTSPDFTDQLIVGAILFEDTMNRRILGKPTAQFLWENARVVPFLKVDETLQAENDGVQLMKPITQLDNRLVSANEHGIYGTKTRSSINKLSISGIKSIVNQQFEIAARIIDAGLMPIVEPEVNINAPNKGEIEVILLDELFNALAKLPAGQQVIFKVTPPDEAGLYTPLKKHASVLDLLGLSGGYSMTEACRRVAENPGMRPSFSRGMREDLKHTQTDEEFNNTLKRNLVMMYEASLT